LCRPALEQNLGKATGRGADIERDEALGSRPKASSAAASFIQPRETKGETPALFERPRIWREQRSRLQRSDAINAYLTEADEIGSARASRGQASIH